MELSAQESSTAWTPAAETDIAGYTIFLGTMPEKLWPIETVADAGATTFVDKLAPGTTYYCAVQAFSSSGMTSEMSAQFSFTTPERATSAAEILVTNSANSAMTSGTDTLSFGTVALGSASRTETVTITNQGVEALTGLDLSFSGPESGDFMVSSLGADTLAPGASTTFDITFVPSATGARSATVQIISNDSDESPFVIFLLGGTTASALYESWAGSGGLSGAAANANAIPFNDAVSNLLKYAFNMNPNGPDHHTLVPGSGTAGLPAISMNLNSPIPYFRVEFLRRKASGLVYTPKLSTNLVDFDRLTGTTTVSSIDDDWERVIIQLPCNPVNTPKLFARVEVTLP